MTPTGFLWFTEKRGGDHTEPVLVAVDAIETVSQVSAVSTLLHLRSGKAVYVKESADTVVADLRAVLDPAQDS